MTSTNTCTHEPRTCCTHTHTLCLCLSPSSFSLSKEYCLQRDLLLKKWGLQSYITQISCITAGTLPSCWCLPPRSWLFPLWYAFSQREAWGINNKPVFNTRIQPIIKRIINQWPLARKYYTHLSLKNILVRKNRGLLILKLPCVSTLTFATKHQLPAYDI